MKQKICDVNKQDYLQLIDVWEKSLRATHDFLPDEEVKQLKPLILNKYFDAVLLKCIKNLEGEIVGFSDVSDCKIEMLFVIPDKHGQGIGSALCQYAIEHQNVTKVDVNEQNPRAKVFYEKMGFKVTNRSELDGQGNPYPILHLETLKP